MKNNSNSYKKMSFLTFIYHTMKKSILVLFAAVLFVSCENIQTNTTAMQANLNANLFRAYSVSAEADNTTQMMTVTGTSDYEEFTLHTEWMGPRGYNLGGNSENYATFTNSNGKVYTTQSEGSFGEIKIKTEDLESQRLTGEFDLTFISANDTIIVSGGVFYDVSYTIADITVD
jgi:hypothetical protein